MATIITALVGLCGTGKSVAAEYIEERFNFKPIYFGGFVLEEVKRRNLEINSRNEKQVREDLRKVSGPDVMAQIALPRINSLLAAGSNVIIDGLYSFSEYLFLRDKFGSQLVLLAVHASKKLRYERLGSREIRPLAPKEVDDRDFFEIKNIEKAGPIAVADYHMINDGNIPDLHRHIDTIFNSLLAE